MSASETSEGYVPSADGALLYYRKVGTGDDTLVVPNAAYMLNDFVDVAAERSVIFYDVRRRGRSQSTGDVEQVPVGVEQDIGDLEAVRAHFGIHRIALLAHSYLGAMVVAYACAHPEHVERIVQIGPVPPELTKQYPPHLNGADATLARITAELAQIAKESRWETEESRDRWDLLVRELCVTEPGDASKLGWRVRDLPNERPGNLMKLQALAAQSLPALKFDTRALAPVAMPVLVIHGRRDRMAAYGGAREWAMLLPNARLVTVENAGHVPWVEAPALVFAAIREFLAGRWPEAAQQVTVLDPNEARTPHREALRGSSR